MTSSSVLPSIRSEFRANIYAQSCAFIINVGLFASTGNYIFIWIEFAVLAFIGMYNAKSPSFFDRNILNHFISVMIFYLISMLIEGSHLLYICLIFFFTYAFFILKDNGYHKSANLWMYLQALLIGTTFTNYPFYLKIIATAIAYIEAQVILNLALRLLNTTAQHQAEMRYHRVLKIPFKTWFNIKRPEVRLAIRGSITAALLYALCSKFNDIKPNWAVVSAIACLQRNDFDASLRAIRGIAIGSITAWPLASLLVYGLNGHQDISAILIWIFLLISLICSFEISIKPRLHLQVINSGLMILAVTCVSTALENGSSYIYLSLKVMNSLSGVGVAFLVLLLWNKINNVGQK
jgi:hypothetical protein